MSDKLRELEYAMVERYLPPSDSGRSGWEITKPEMFSAVKEIVFLRQKKKSMISEIIIVAVDDFIEIVMDDLKLAEEEENNTETFHTAAHKRAKDAFKQLDNIINQALGVDELPIK
jgi:fructose 1,6-bisphosphatase